jgi:DNA-directed RNA polymerase specialized sigma24 family protein
MDIPRPPRDEWSFREFYTARRARMIALVRVQAAGKVRDPELVAEDGWWKFFPHWKDCEHPDAYVRQCMISAANDALRAGISEPRPCDLAREPGFATPAARDLPADPDDKPWDPELAGALQSLSPKLREFVLLDIELNLGERSVAEIAGILGISRTAAFNRKQRAYAKLCRLLPADYLELRKARRRGRGGVEGWSTP